MDSFNQTAGFRYYSNANSERDAEYLGILEIFVHHARNIHNICIYDNQDVYAKFSLTYNPDETLSTRIINGGGKNPEFNQNLIMEVAQFDAILKCEIWMLSRAKNYLEDQLLGFALVPISSIVGKGKMTQDFSLSSTDLFHSPAGTIKLTLSFNPNPALNPSISLFSDSSITSEVVFLDRKISEVDLSPVEYSRIEFPDINVMKENQQMVSEYFDLAAGHGSLSPPGQIGLGSFLYLGASCQTVGMPRLQDSNKVVDDCEMSAILAEDVRAGSVSPNGSVQNSGFMSSTMTSLSDDRNSADSMEKNNHVANEVVVHSPSASITTTEANQSPTACAETPTSRKGSETSTEKEPNFPGKEENNATEQKMASVKFGQVFAAPLGNANLEGEQSAMQQQIVDMYMRSMQQFTESLAKMKLPMDLDKPEAENHNNEVNIEKKKDSSRVFYGSRAFF